MTGIIDLVSGLPAAILGFFADAGTWLLDVGRNILEGMWEGISGAVDWLTDKLADFVGDVTDSVLGFFGIGSPSKLFRDKIGKWLPAGIAEGIDQNAGVAVDAATTPSPTSPTPCPGCSTGT